MTAEQLDIVNKTLEGVFKDAPKATIVKSGDMGDVIAVENWTISKTDHVHSRFHLDIGIDGDVVDVADHHAFPDVVETLILGIARMRVRNIHDAIATDNMVKEYEREQQERL